MASLIALLCTLYAVTAGATPFHSDSGHYTIDLPEGWVSVPIDQSILLNLHLPVMAGGMPAIDACFRPKTDGTTMPAPTAVPMAACIVVEPYPAGHAPPFAFHIDSTPDAPEPIPGQNEGAQYKILQNIITRKIAPGRNSYFAYLYLLEILEV